MSSWSCDESVCASCRYWRGTRKVDSKDYSVEALDENGTCRGLAGTFWGHDMSEGSSCSEWELYREER